MTQVLPLGDELTDDEDFDNNIVDDNQRGPTFVPPEGSGTVELHRYGEETAVNSEQTVYEMQCLIVSQWM